MKKWLAATVCGLAIATAPVLEAGPVEWRPSVGGGYAKVVESHGSLSAALRIQFAGVVFVQPEYLALFADGHTDRGPTVLVGVSGKSRTSLRFFAGLGGGPVDGFQDDDGMFFVAAGASHTVGRSGAFVQGELRYGGLGGNVYSQFAVSIGFSR